MERVRWIVHKGRRIILPDLNGLTINGYLKVIREYEKIVLKNNRIGILFLTYVSDDKAFGETLQEKYTPRNTEKVWYSSFQSENHKKQVILTLPTV